MSTAVCFLEVTTAHLNFSVLIQVLSAVEASSIFTSFLCKPSIDGVTDVVLSYVK